MSETIILPAPSLDPPALPLPKWEREYQAFRRLLPQLLHTHRGQYVAIHEGQVIDSGPERLPLVLRVLDRLGNVSIHVGLVSEEPEPAARSGVRREVSRS